MPDDDDPSAPDHPPEDHPPGEEPPEEEEEHEADEAIETTEKALKAAGKVVEVVGKAMEGDGAGAMAAGLGAGVGVLETVGGALGEEAEEAAEAIEAVAEILEVGEAGVELGEKLEHLSHGGGHEPEHGGGHRSHGSSSRHGSDGGHSSEHDDHGDHEEHEPSSGNVHYEVEVEGVDEALSVRSLHFEDGVSSIPSCSLQLACESHVIGEETELFDKEVTLTIDRGHDQRLFRGIVRRAHVANARDEQHLELDVVPAIWLLSQTRDSRVFQDMTVPDLVEELMSEYLADRGRTVRRELANEGDYQTHEYLVQYRESHFDFITRLCDEEGIWFYFDHSEGDREILVLADSNDNRARISGGRNGRVEYTDRSDVHDIPDAAFLFTRARWMGATDAVVTDYDWTNPPLTVRHEETGRGDWRGPALETHEHDNAARFHGYEEGGGQYQGHSATHRAQLASQRHDLSRARWSCSTSVVGIEPGHTFELTNAEDHDGRYLVLRVSVSGSPGGSGGGYQARLDLVPQDVPYRPSHPQRPLVHGPETAMVVGPSGEEIHVDKHGRVKVQFHWDRRGGRDELAGTWIRVAQFWSGPGWGSMFIPRIGTEVIVNFMGGDPDRPVITGRLYNGNHPLPYALPEHKTRSTIMTNSSPNKNGFNELRFEDKAGDEEVYIHAEKDFNEEVKNCHSTHVGVDQSNTVDHDQTETVKHDQTLTVENSRNKTVVNRETNIVKGTRHTTIGEEGGDDILRVHNNRMEQIDGDDDQLEVTVGNKTTTVTAGKWDIATKGEFKVLQNSLNQLYIQDTFYVDTIGRVQLKSGDGVHYLAEPGGRLKIKNTEKLHIESDSDQLIESTGGNIKVHTPQKITLSADAEIVFECGESMIKLTPSGIEIEGGTIKINASSGVTEIDAASQVKIKC